MNTFSESKNLQSFHHRDQLSWCSLQWVCQDGFSNCLFVFSSAPCVPHSIQHHLDCPSGDLNVTWQQTGHATHFRVIVESSNGEVSTCNTEEHHCVISSLQCGLTYSYEVVAQDNRCNNTRSPKQELTTGKWNCMKGTSMHASPSQVSSLHKRPAILNQSWILTMILHFNVFKAVLTAEIRSLHNETISHYIQYCSYPCAYISKETKSTGIQIQSQWPNPWR